MATSPVWAMSPTNTRSFMSKWTMCRLTSIRRRHSAAGPWCRPSRFRPGHSRGSPTPAETQSDCGKRSRARSGRPDRKRRFAQDLLLKPLLQWKGAEVIQIFLDIGDSWAGPVRAKQCFVGNFTKPRKILQQALGRDAANIEIDIRMPPDQKKCRVHPEGPATVRQQDFYL